MSLQNLEDILECESIGSSYTDPSNCKEYMLDYAVYEKHLDKGLAVSSEVTRQALISEALKLISDHDTTTPFRICSIGFGSGILEVFLLSEISKKFPRMPVEFVGVDINKESCQNLQKLLTEFPNYKSVIYNQDIEAGLPVNTAFHCVLAVHILYYLESCLPYITELLHDHGSLFVVLDREGKIFLPYTKVWNKGHPGKCTLYSERLPAAAAKLNVSCVLLDSTKIKLNLTDAIKNNFASTENRCLLNFIVHAKLENYSEEMKMACINYFKSLVKFESGNLIVNLFEDIYVLRK